MEKKNSKKRLSPEEIIARFAKHLPHFSDGRIDYTDSHTAPVVNIVVKCKDKILLLKRSSKVKHYQHVWNVVGGYLDEIKPVETKVLEEIKEELSVDMGLIKSIKVAKHFRVSDKKIDKIWIVFPVLVILTRQPKIKLDWEHTEFRWVGPAELDQFETVPGLNSVLSQLIT